MFLARHLEFTIKSPDLAWWQLRQATYDLALEDAAAIERIKPSRGLRFTPGGLVFGILFGVVGGLVIGLFCWFHRPGLGSGLVGGLLFGMFGLGVNAFGLWPVSGALEAAATPRALLARERRTVLVGLGSALAIWLAVGLGFGLGFGLRFVPLGAGVLAGLLLAVTMGLLYSWGNSVWPPYMLPEGGWRCITACRGR